MAAVGSHVIWGNGLKAAKSEAQHRERFLFLIFFFFLQNNIYVPFQSVCCQLIYPLIIALSCLVCLL